MKVSIEDLGDPVKTQLAGSYGHGVNKSLVMITDILTGFRVFVVTVNGVPHTHLDLAIALSNYNEH